MPRTTHAEINTGVARPDPIALLEQQAAMAQMPTVVDSSRDSVVILRMRGADDAGSTMIDMLDSYAQALNAAGSKLVVVTDNERVIRQLRVTGITDIIGDENVYQGTVFVGEAVRRAYADATEWIAERGSVR